MNGAGSETSDVYNINTVGDRILLRGTPLVRGMESPKKFSRRMSVVEEVEEVSEVIYR